MSLHHVDLRSGCKTILTMISFLFHANQSHQQLKRGFAQVFGSQLKQYSTPILEMASYGIVGICEQVELVVCGQ